MYLPTKQTGKSKMNNSDMPAMPQTGAIGPSGDMYRSEEFGGEGLTKREHFAAMAMQGMCANTEYVTKDWKDIVVKESAYMADALLAELAKEQG